MASATWGGPTCRSVLRQPRSSPLQRGCAPVAQLIPASLQRGTLQGSGGCLGAAFDSQRVWGSFPSEGRSEGRADAARCARRAAARSSGSAFCPRCCTRSAQAGKSPCGSEAALLACRSRREAQATQPAGSAAGRCSARCRVRERGAAPMLSARTRRGGRGGSLPAAGQARRPGGNARATAGELLRALRRPCRHLCLEGHPREDRTGHLPSPSPPGLGARRLAARGAQGVPPGILDRGSGCGFTALPLTCGAAADARSPPPTRGR